MQDMALVRIRAAPSARCTQTGQQRTLSAGAQGARIHPEETGSRSLACPRPAHSCTRELGPRSAVVTLCGGTVIYAPGGAMLIVASPRTLRVATCASFCDRAAHPTDARYRESQNPLSRNLMAKYPFCQGYSGHFSPCCGPTPGPMPRAGGRGYAIPIVGHDIPPLR